MSGAHVLYGGGVTRSVGVEIVLRELDLPYELVEVETQNGEHRAPEFLRINPAGFVPALVTPDGGVLHENAAIMLWLADSHPAEALAPAPDDTQRGLFLSKLFFHTNDIQPAVKRFFYPGRYSAETGAAAAIRTRARDMALERWGVLDQHLARNGPYHQGERYSIADAHMAVWAVFGFETCDEVLDRFGSVRRCFELAAARAKSGGLIEDFRSRVRAWRNELG